MEQLPKNWENPNTGMMYELTEIQQSEVNPETGETETWMTEVYLPEGEESPEPEQVTGRYALMRRHYLKNHRPGFYQILRMRGLEAAHLKEIEETSMERLERMTKELAEQEGVTEQMKADDNMVWIQKMTNIRNRAEEAILQDLIYS